MNITTNLWIFNHNNFIDGDPLVETGEQFASRFRNDDAAIFIAGGGADRVERIEMRKRDEFHFLKEIAAQEFATEKSSDFLEFREDFSPIKDS